MTWDDDTSTSPSKGDEARRREMLQDLRETCRALIDARWALTVDIASVKAIGIALAKRRFTPDEAEAMIARTWPELAEENDDGPLSSRHPREGGDPLADAVGCGGCEWIPGQARDDEDWKIS